MCAQRDRTPRTPECPGLFASLRSEQGIVSLAPFCGYLLKAKGVTTFVTPFAYLTVLRATPIVGGRKTDNGAYRYRYAPLLVPKLGRLSQRERQERCDAKIKIMPAAFKAAGICCAQVGS